ncbi:MAG: hypothetical protein RLY88_588 [Actinomycetota bacterium]
MARRRISSDAGWAAVSEVKDGDSTQLATAVRFLLEELAAVAPGNSVEVRVPPLGATQCIEGPRHTRGTPPNTVEMSPEVWFAVATGKLAWADALATGQISASGVRADLSQVLPLARS